MSDLELKLEHIQEKYARRHYEDPCSDNQNPLVWLQPGLQREGIQYKSRTRHRIQDDFEVVFSGGLINGYCDEDCRKYVLPGGGTHLINGGSFG